VEAIEYQLGSAGTRTRLEEAFAELKEFVVAA
jgi:hypothetical protein